jgi:hypothetical protein
MDLSSLKGLASGPKLCGIKTVSCLRIGKKREKPFSRTVFKFGKQNNEIKNYLQFKRNLRRFL